MVTSFMDSPLLGQAIGPLGLLRTYFYYCRIVGLVPVIPFPQKNNWTVTVLQFTTIIRIGAQRTQRSLFAQPTPYTYMYR